MEQSTTIGAILPKELFDMLEKDAKAHGETVSRRAAQIVAEALGYSGKLRKQGRPPMKRSS